MIHAEPGNNVVRSYPVENDGAGYKATIVNILEAQKDQWFRPIDVAIAPDGSLFVADWYDPGVGGHQVGDVERGRIYRIAPRNSKYTISQADVSNPDHAIQALMNPNHATRILGWNALVSMGEDGEKALKKVWTSSNSRQLAQVFWLLLNTGENKDEYIAQALADNDPNIRIAAIRGARFLKKDIIPMATKLVQDPSPQVRRELAIALRGNSTQAAANLWTQLAQQYDGKDRWYLEALGIGAAGNWDLYFDTWKNAVGDAWSSTINTDIVWRSRSKSAIPLLAELIRSTDGQAWMRYYRAFDFHSDPSKQKVLAMLAEETNGGRLLYALKHMDPSQIKMTSRIRAELDTVLTEQTGRPEFVELVREFPTVFELENDAATDLRIDF